MMTDLSPLDSAAVASGFGWYTLALGTLTLVVGFSDRLLGYPIQQFFSSL